MKIGIKSRAENLPLGIKWGDVAEIMPEPQGEPWKLQPAPPAATVEIHVGITLIGGMVGFKYLQVDHSCL